MYNPILSQEQKDFYRDLISFLSTKTSLGQINLSGDTGVAERKLEIREIKSGTRGTIIKEQA